MKRLFWMGVGVGVTVAAVRYGRKLYAQYVPADAAAAFDTAAKVGRTARGVLGVWLEGGERPVILLDLPETLAAARGGH